LKRTVLLGISFIISSLCFSQFAGTSSFDILNLSPSAKISGLGGYNVSLRDNDQSIAYFNPSLLDTTYNSNGTFSWGGLFQKYTNIDYRNVSYADSYKSYTFACNFMVINYGKIEAKDEYNNYLGLATAADYVIGFSVAKSVYKYVTVGTTLKPIMSYIANYSSYALAADVGVSYHDSTGSTGISFVARNIGYEVKPFSTVGVRDQLPFEMDMGFSKRLSHSPFRFSVTYRNLQKFNLSYQSTISNTSVSTGDTSNSKKTGMSYVTDNIARHLIIGGEIFISKLYLSAGYNMRQRIEASSLSKKGSIGYSFGVGFNTSMISFGYGYQCLTLAGGTNTFTLTTNMDRIVGAFKKKLN